MRIQITFDGATTESVREMTVALHRVGLTGELKVACDGPELWSGTTPKMRSDQWARVAASLIKWQGAPIAEVLDGLRDAAAAS